MQIERKEKNKCIKIRDISTGEAFFHNDELWVKIPKYSEEGYHICVFKESAHIPVWNVTKKLYYSFF